LPGNNYGGKIQARLEKEKLSFQAASKQLKREAAPFETASGFLKREYSLCGMDCLNGANVGTGTTIGTYISVYLIDIAF